MNRGLSFFVASLQSLVTLAVAIGLIVAPLTIAWLFEGDGSVEWIVVLRVAVFAFLLACGVDLEFPPGQIIGIEYPYFVMDAMPLGLTALLVVSAARIGHRLSSASSLWPAWIGAAITMASGSVALSEFSSNEFVRFEQWQPLFMPTLLFTSVVIGFSVFGKRFELFDGANGPEAPERIAIREFVFGIKDKLHWSISTTLNPSFRAGLSVVVVLLLFSSLVIGLALAFGWVEVVRLYEGMRVSIVGGVMLTLGQLALLPNLVIYGMAWLSGVGFSIGTGSLVSPLGTELGPMPAIPMFAAIPTGTFDQALVFVLVPMIAAFLATFFVRGHLDEMRWEYATRFSAAISYAVTTALVATLAASLLASWASGGFGPGRLGVVGVNLLLFAPVFFIEVLLPSFVAGLLVIKPYTDAAQRRG